MTTTNSTTQTFTRAQIESIVEQIKAVNIDGTPVFTVQHDEESDARESYAFVQMKVPGYPFGGIVTFALDRSEVGACTLAL